MHVDLVRLGIITSATLKKKERGEPVSIKVVEQLCEGLGVSVEQVIDFNAVQLCTQMTDSKPKAVS